MLTKEENWVGNNKLNNIVKNLLKIYGEFGQNLILKCKINIFIFLLPVFLRIFLPANFLRNYFKLQSASFLVALELSLLLIFSL